MADRDFTKRFWAKVEKRGPNDCWLWTASKDRHGYGTFQLNGKPRKAHRLSWVLSNGPVPDGFCVCHSCDVRLCVNPSHLWAGSNKANTVDMVAKGRNVTLRGEEASWSKLTNEEVVAIKSTVGVSQRKMARQYGVCQTMISKIRLGDRWRHVT